MSMKPGPYRFIILLMLVGYLTACSPSPTPVPATESQQPVTRQPQQPSLEPTSEPTATQSLDVTLQPTPEFTPGLECTVLQDLNLRKGPGVAYTPPISVLPKDAILVPLGFEAKGIPRGSWVMVLDPNTQQIGWVNAASTFVSCNSDIATLPKVAVEPPPPPEPPSAQSSSVEGACGEGGIPGKNGNIFDCAVELIEEGSLPVQFIVIKDGQEIGKPEGVEKVEFRVKKDGKVIYSRAETNKDYCFFGGDGPCDSWVLEDYVYKWEPGGAVVEPGEYVVLIDTTLKNEPDVVLHWEATVEISTQQ
jgi:hypothetical protein